MTGIRCRVAFVCHPTRSKGRTLPYDGPSMRRTIRAVVAGLLLVGCASATYSVADNGSAAAALREAAERTLGVQSFHVDATIQLPSSSGKATIDYQAPDREHEWLGAGRAPRETISIEDTVYITALHRPGYFWKIEGHGSGRVTPSDPCASWSRRR